MSISLFVLERDKGPQSPPLYPRKNMKEWQFNSRISNIQINKHPHFSEMSNIQKSSIHMSPSFHINIPKKLIGYKNLPLTPITRYKNLITGFQLKTFRKCFITMKIDSKHENVWKALKMNNQGLGLAILETKKNPNEANKWERNGQTKQ